MAGSRLSMYLLVAAMWPGEDRPNVRVSQTTLWRFIRRFLARTLVGNVTS
jgi:hypothetical protein